ncbi:hypothetical protein B0O99DRAFT_617832 [Bisporella sp. PMI_857]|nr:hypothetical protein B0O99DRAFT_617832 [Bisporella sp. PMI_857]
MLAFITTPLVFLSSLALAPLESWTSAPVDVPSLPNIFVINAGDSGTSIVRNALGVLGITPVSGDHVRTTPQAESPRREFKELPLDFPYRDIIKSQPSAKFILPFERTGGSTFNHTGSALEGEIDQNKVLKIEIGGTEKYAGETWERLCRFLDLGYSVMERGKLREFPPSYRGREESRRVVGGRFGYGYGYGHGGIRVGASS